MIGSANAAGIDGRATGILESAALPAESMRAVLERRDVLHIDDCDLNDARALVQGFGTQRYGYVVTANVDHVVRYYHHPDFRALYAAATYVLLDSRFLVHALRLLKRQSLRASPGSDLTTALFEHTIRPHDVVLVVGGAEWQAHMLREQYGLKALRHINVPMKLIDDPAAIEVCLRDIEAASPFRFCFIALGSPLQEMIAHKLQERAVARGLALCVGGAINYMTGAERRAPRWMQRIGFEWLFRLVQHPRRMAYRYLIRGPRIFWLAARIELRPKRPAFFHSDREILESPVASDMINIISSGSDSLGGSRRSERSQFVISSGVACRRSNGASLV
jgi:exopolysaccharide biosynthesis WecB/TagA/CpsF family protein